MSLELLFLNRSPVEVLDTFNDIMYSSCDELFSSSDTDITFYIVNC